MTLSDDQIPMHGGSFARSCFRLPIPEIEEAAHFLKAAVSAHMRGERSVADELFRLADNKVIRKWTEPDEDGKRPYIRLRRVPNAPLSIKDKRLRAKPRYASAQTTIRVHKRDGYYCRFCKIPVVRANVRKRIQQEYPSAIPWGTRNVDMHAALLCMWAQYDHLVPHSRGGTSEFDNVVLTCGPCNWDRGEATLEEVGIVHPDNHEPRRGDWDGLEGFE